MEDNIQANKLLLLGKLTANLVHEIRNPLSAIKLNLDYMKLAQDDLPSDIQEILSESLDAFEQINFLIEDVLDFTRKPSAKIHQVAVEAITEKCLKIILISAKNKNITIEKDFEKDIPILNVNKNKMMQIFLNLLNNAIEASSEKSRIIIRAFRKKNEENYCVIWEVQDFGIGIKSEDKQKILDGFYTTKSSGNGIGLGVCRKLSDELNAEIYFNSEYGIGTTFSIKFFVA
jgi:signal transduction histidine kinase